VATFWAKEAALVNMYSIFETDATLHLPIGWLNAEAFLNMPNMVDTDATFHPPMSALNVGL
jgi:hypothetical protein